MKFGLLLPHFGEHASRTKLLDGAKLAEEIGFDSVWVRDHLVFEPHGEMEKPNRTFYDALTTLTAIGAVTERIELGTGSLIPFRHPLVTALMAGTITQLVGPRLILGFGAGTFDHEFEAIEMGGPRPSRAGPLQRRDPAARLHRERRRLLRRQLHFQRRDDRAEAGGRAGPVLVLRCHPPLGPAGGRVLRRLDARPDLDGDAGQANRRPCGSCRARQGKPMPTVAVIPPTSIERTRDEALQHVNIPGLLAWANKAKFAVKPPSGRFETVEDLSGQLIVGHARRRGAGRCTKFADARGRAPGLRLPVQVRPVVRPDRVAGQGSDQPLPVLEIGGESTWGGRRGLLRPRPSIRGDLPDAEVGVQGVERAVRANGVAALRRAGRGVRV